jgi:hypothetical protein
VAKGIVEHITLDDLICTLYRASNAFDDHLIKQRNATGLYYAIPFVVDGTGIRGVPGAAPAGVVLKGRHGSYTFARMFIFEHPYSRTSSDNPVRMLKNEHPLSEAV